MRRYCFVRVMLIKRQCASVVIIMVSFWIFQTISVSVCPAGVRLSRAPPNPPRPRDRTTIAPHGSARCSWRKKAPNAKLGERGASKGALPGTTCWVPGKEADIRGGRGV